MKKTFRVIINETRGHYYNVVAEDKDSAREKVEDVYINNADDNDVILVEGNNPEENEIIYCEEFNDDIPLNPKCLCGDNYQEHYLDKDTGKYKCYNCGCENFTEEKNE